METVPGHDTVKAQFSNTWEFTLKTLYLCSFFNISPKFKKTAGNFYAVSIYCEMYCSLSIAVLNIGICSILSSRIETIFVSKLCTACGCCNKENIINSEFNKNFPLLHDLYLRDIKFVFILTTYNNLITEIESLNYLP